MALVLGAILLLRLHAFLALIGSALIIGTLTPTSSLERFAAAEWDKEDHLVKLNTDGSAHHARQQAQKELSNKPVTARVAEGFGETCRKVGILIAMASVIGVCLLESGGARRIVDVIIGLFGAARAQLAFLLSGFLLAIPVFFDTVFYLLMPIGKAMRRKTGKNYLLYILAIVAGGTMAHSLIPPTPGPMFVAAELKVELGVMMAAGIVVGLFAVAFGYAWAVWMNKRHDFPLPDEGTNDRHSASASVVRLPPAWFAFLPILVPVGMLATGSILTLSDPERTEWWLDLLSDKNLALVLGAAIALILLALYSGKDREQSREKIQKALQSGAGIILITAAGGAFGAILRQTAIGVDIAEQLGSSASWLALPVVFILTTIVRTAQGSATVAMITAAPVAAAFVSEVTFHPVYLALAIGCGSKPIPWMNDSGFWIITRMSGMKESQTLRFVTPMMSLMGVVGFVVTLLGAWLVPMR